MQILSALDAISPAFARTKLVLYSPFRKGRTWKLATTGYLAVASSIFLPLPLVYLLFLPLLRDQLGRTGELVIIGVVLLATAVFLAIFYLVTRLQFCFFDIVLNCGEFVAPAWRKYGQPSAKWTLMKAVIGTAIICAFGLPIAAYVRHLIRVVQSLKPGEQPPSEFIAAIFGGYALVFFGFAALFLLSSVLSDFMVPSLALENATLGESFRRIMHFARREPGQFTAYVFLKLALGIAGYMAQALAFYAVLFVYLIALALVLGIGYFVLHVLHVSTAVMAVLAVIVAFPTYLLVSFYSMLLLIGTVCTFLQAYALYFLGGRYPPLGDLLERSTPPPAPLPLSAAPWNPALYTPPPV